MARSPHKRSIGRHHSQVTTGIGSMWWCVWSTSGTATGRGRMGSASPILGDTLQAHAHQISSNFRATLPWLGLLLFGGIAAVATLHLASDAWRVVSRIDSLAGVRIALTAAAVIAAGLLYAVSLACRMSMA